MFGVKLMIAYRNGVVVCTNKDQLWFGKPDSMTGEWTWSLIS